MSQWDKLLARICALSKDLRFDELRKVLESCGYGVVHTRNVDRDELYPVLRRLRRTRTAGK